MAAKKSKEEDDVGNSAALYGMVMEITIVQLSPKGFIQKTLLAIDVLYFILFFFNVSSSFFLGGRGCNQQPIKPVELRCCNQE